MIWARGRQFYPYILEMSRFNQSLDLINELSVQELRQLNRDQLLFIVSGLTGEEIREFMFAKNTKIFGGINGYVDNFLSTGTINKIKAMNGQAKISAKSGAIETLNKMLTYDELTDANRTKINDAISELNGYLETAPAAGGRRKNKTRRSKHTRRNRLKK